MRPAYTSAPASSVPVDRVKDLSLKGMPESEIIKTLKSEGYQISAIDAAMKEALRSRVAPEPYRMSEPEYMRREPEPPPRVPMEPDIAPAPVGPPSEDSIQAARRMEGGDMTGRDFVDEGSELPPLEEDDYQKPEEQEFIREPVRYPRKQGGDVEEIAEAIVEERLGTFKEQLKYLDSEMENLKGKIQMIEAKLENASVQPARSESIETKIDDYQKSIDGLQTRMASMEGALKTSLTPMIESMRSLSETVKSLKEKG